MPEPQSPTSTAATDGVMTRGLGPYVLIASGISIILGSLITWVHVDFFVADVPGFRADGRFTLPLGLGVAVFGVAAAARPVAHARCARLVGSTLAGVAAAIALIDLATLSTRVGGSDAEWMIFAGEGRISPGPGLYVVIVAGLVGLATIALSRNART